MANLFKRYETEAYPGIWTVVCEDDVEELEKYGQGPTLEAARDDWGVRLVERIDDHIYDMGAAGEIDQTTATMTFEAIDQLA